MTSRPVELAPEPVHDDVTWVSSYDVNPFDVPLAEKTGLFAGWTRELLAADGVDHATGSLQQVQENKYYADLGRLLDHPAAGPARAARRGARRRRGVRAPSTRCARSRRRSGAAGSTSPATPSTSTPSGPSSPSCCARSSPRPSVEAGTYDLVIHPSNLWLTIHESIGHATELDRALGYEANYAGTSFATYDQLDTLRYGSPVMHVTGDRTVEHGLSTVGYDDEGVATQQWDIVRDGVLVGYQLDRPMAHTYGAELNDGRSNGCAYADSPGHIPIQRMANVSLQPAPDGPDTDGLISQVERGIYVVGDKSWSIDMQRYNFQFTGQRFYAIEDGELEGPAPRRRLPGHHHRLLGRRWRRSAGRRPTSSAAPSTAARPSPARSPRSATAARRRCSAASAILNTTEEGTA